MLSRFETQLKILNQGPVVERVDNVIQRTERFSIECLKTRTKVITLANHNRCKQRKIESIRNQSKHM